MRPILAAILLGISIAALGSPGGGGGGGGGHGGGGSGGAHASGAVHGGGSNAGSRSSGGPHLSAEAHPGAVTPHPSIAAALRGWWHHRHGHTEHGYAATDRETLCTDEQRRLVNCRREDAARER